MFFKAKTNLHFITCLWYAKNFKCAIFKCWFVLCVCHPFFLLYFKSWSCPNLRVWKKNYCIWTCYLKRLNVILFFICVLEFSPIRKSIKTKIWELKMFYTRKIWFTWSLKLWSLKNCLLVFSKNLRQISLKKYNSTSINTINTLRLSKRNYFLNDLSQLGHLSFLLSNK